MELVIQCALAAIGFLLTMVIHQAGRELRDFKERVQASMAELRKTAEDLNVKIAVIIERVDSHEMRIQRLED